LTIESFQLLEVGILAKKSDVSARSAQLFFSFVISWGAFLRGWRCKTTTHGKSPSSKTSTAITDTMASTTISPTQSSAIDARLNFFRTDHRPTKQSTTCMSQKHSPNLCDTPTRRQVSQPNRRGSRPSKNKQHTSWPGLTREAVNKHFPESEETLTGIHILAHICATFINKLRASLITF
jgi:hypothetical protein